MDNTVKITNVTKSYRQGARVVQALRGINLEVPAGEFLAIMGASGSGKSTLLHLCAALDNFDSGEIAVAGQTLRAMTERERTHFRRCTIGVVFQSFNLIPTLSAYENVALPALLEGPLTEAHRTRITSLLELLHLTDRATHRPDALSGGEQQRVEIARALLMRPGVLFADEPTGNLDSTNAHQLWQMLAEAAQSTQTTVVMVTHEPAAALYAHRVVVLRDGTISGAFATKELRDVGDLAARYQTLAR